MLADTVVSLSGRDRVGEATRAPGARLECGAPDRKRRARVAGVCRSTEPAMACRPRASSGPPGPTTWIGRRSRLCAYWLKLLGPFGGRYGSGLVGCPPQRYSKWTCGPVELPVDPSY